ncbi:hypothetical protein BGE01nite_46360 [Brevifollis gellanilyticus]|uniref:DUF3828 domain-containing protein n=2 Tax=Brevifollis gellanilyticus TaxID=748831 RepID=A0A512MF30_9BACT|nr:hypothetical protein BGE01nite_46360 [Brevifollis gellanilyticus]
MFKHVMKPLAPLLALTLAYAAFTTGRSPEERLAPISDAAKTFYTTLRAERISGLPSEEQMKKLSGLLTPGLHAAILKARAEQQEQIKKHPDDKPNWIEGDLFGSLFEGVTQWELGSAFFAPGVDGTVKVNLTYQEATEKPTKWTDILVFKQREEKWLLDDIRMGGEWAFKSADSLRGRLPGGWQAREDHDSPDEKWHVTFQRDGEVVSNISIQAADKSGLPHLLFGAESSPAGGVPSWVLWNPDSDLLAVRLGDSPRFTRTLIFRLVGHEWKKVEMPVFYAEEKKTMAGNGFRETDSLIDADHWYDANTLVVKYFSSWANGDDGDGYSKYISVQISADGKASVTEAVDTPGKD